MKRKATTTEISERATKMLVALLKSPKTRRGLCASVAGLGLTNRYVWGWLAVEVREGRVMLVQTPSQKEPLYIMATAVIDPEEMEPSIYPSWMEPRRVPRFTSRRFIASLDFAKQQEESEPRHEKITRKAAR
jgi:hypothetical protein